MATPPTSAPVAATPAKPIPPGKAKPGRGYWSDVWRRFRRKRSSVLALAFVVILTNIAIFAPLIAGT
ncbi:MAG TPA: hypothetical protein VL096_08295, partial [Pirellulaceae bacterium]|nr:hypothetical protein [Pirellulaceae bacterium]